MCTEFEVQDKFGTGQQSISYRVSCIMYRVSCIISYYPLYILESNILY